MLDSTILTLLLDPIDLDAFGFLLYTLSSGDVVITGVIVDSLRGTSLVEPKGFDLLALVAVFTPVEVNKGLLESFVLRELVCLGMLLKDVTAAYVIEEQKQTWFLATAGDDQIILVTAANGGLPAVVYKCIRLLHRCLVGMVLLVKDCLNDQPESFNLIHLFDLFLLSSSGGEVSCPNEAKARTIELKLDVSSQDEKGKEY
nr:hypothetical protein [Tanacetum cinerariifolium]